MDDCHCRRAYDVDSLHAAVSCRYAASLGAEWWHLCACRNIKRCVYNVSECTMFNCAALFPVSADDQSVFFSSSLCEFCIVYMVGTGHWVKRFWPETRCDPTRCTTTTTTTFGFSRDDSRFSRVPIDLPKKNLWSGDCWYTIFYMPDALPVTRPAESKHWSNSDWTFWSRDLYVEISHISVGTVGSLTDWSDPTLLKSLTYDPVTHFQLCCVLPLSTLTDVGSVGWLVGAWYTHGHLLHCCLSFTSISFSNCLGVHVFATYRLLLIVTASKDFVMFEIYIAALCFFRHGVEPHFVALL